MLTTFISPFRSDQERVRGLMMPGDFLEIFCNCPLEVCEQRDVKGLYKKARAGEVKEFSGISSPYEEPIKDLNRLRKLDQARQSARIMLVLIECCTAYGKWPWMLYSDESLIESMSGLSARLEHGDRTALETVLSEIRSGSPVTLVVTLRDPIPFMRASYYKTMEFHLRYGEDAISFDAYIRFQMEIHRRAPTASRLFLAMHRPLVEWLSQWGYLVVVNRLEDLLAADHVLDALLGISSGEPAMRMADLPRENSSFIDPAVNRFILSAPGVPAGVGIEEYSAGFAEALARYGLDDLFAEAALESATA